MNLTDGNRTKEFQDFFTPESVSQKAFDLGKKYLKKNKVNKILEPAVGSGNLIWKYLESEYQVEVTCLDIQPKYLEHTWRIAEDKGFKPFMRDDIMRIKNF